MNLISFLLISLISLYGTVVISDDIETKLELIQIVFRHGERTPVLSYPTDIYNETQWHKYGGFGQLTQAGMKRHNHFGKFLRSRYGDFLNKYYNRNEVFIRSTNYDRTLMSAYSLLSGLYEPMDYQKWNDNVGDVWQPIAVHTTDSKLDNVFYQNECPRKIKATEKVENSAEYKNTTKNYQDIIELIDTYSGYNNMTINELWKIADTVFVEKDNNLTLPDWVQKHYQRIESTRDICFYFDFYNDELAKLTSGGVLNEMRKNIKSKIENKTPQQQLYLFSSHDTYVAAMTKLLNFTDRIRTPPYASAIAIELRKSVIDETKYYVQVYHKNNSHYSDITYDLVKIYGCDVLCPYEDFLKIIKDKCVENYAETCADLYTVVKSNILYILIGVLVLFSTLLIIKSAITLKKSNPDPTTQGFRPLEQEEDA